MAKKYSKGAQKKIATVMREYSKGDLETSHGTKVKSRKQAKAIALSEARQAGEKVPKKK